MKQCLSLLLALCLAFTLAAPALAEATPLEQAPLAPESAPAADSAAAVPEPETGAAPVDLAQAPLAQEALAGEAAAGAAKEGKDASGTQAFVTRLYQTVLGRAPDAAGLATWVNALNGRQMTGAQVAQNMFQSPEYQRRGRTDAQYIDDLYRAMFGRAPDAAGTQTWQDALDNGVSRLFLLAGFAGGSEFAALCRQYGIAQGSVAVTENRDKNYSVTQFVARLYRLCLGRKADTSGLNDWCGWLLSGQQTGASAAAGFVFSAECKNQGLSDTAFVQMLYRAFMDREADASGQRTWTQALADGASREWVFNGFAASKEFANICARYGIQVGQSPVQGQPAGFVVFKESQVYNGVEYVAPDQASRMYTTKPPFLPGQVPLSNPYIYRFAIWNDKLYFIEALPGSSPIDGTPTSLVSPYVYESNLDGTGKRAVVKMTYGATIFEAGVAVIKNGRLFTRSTTPDEIQVTDLNTYQTSRFCTMRTDLIPNLYADGDYIYYEIGYKETIYRISLTTGRETLTDIYCLIPSTGNHQYFACKSDRSFAIYYRDPGTTSVHFVCDVPRGRTPLTYYANDNYLIYGTIDSWYCYHISTGFKRLITQSDIEICGMRDDVAYLYFYATDSLQAYNMETGQLYNV